MKNVKHKQLQYESGRSMVEMLGTLAIVGVLSIGGITGYNYAINKYRANETINEINMRLMTLQTQSERDMDLNLNEFADKTPLGYTIGDNYGWAEDDTRIYVGLSGIPQKACEIIYNEMISKIERIDVTADRNADANTLCGDNNEMKFYINSGVEAECDPPCGENEICAGGEICVKNERVLGYKEKCTTDADCSECTAECKSGSCWKEVPKNGDECDDGAGICTNGVCLPKPESVCKTNEDCPVGEYCAIKNTWQCNPQTYGCAPIDLVQKTITLSNGKQETWYLSKYLVDWWNAEAMCAALGKKLPTREELEYLERGTKLRRAGGAVLWTRSETNCSMVWCFQSATNWMNQSKGNHHTFSAVCR